MTKSGKHCGKRINCSFWTISSFVTMFSKSRLLQRRQKASIWGKGLTHTTNLQQKLWKTLFKWKNNHWIKLKTLWQKEKLLILNNFSFCHYIFMRSLLQRRQHMSTVKLVLWDNSGESQDLAAEHRLLLNTSQVKKEMLFGKIFKWLLNTIWLNSITSLTKCLRKGWKWNVKSYFRLVSTSDNFGLIIGLSVGISMFLLLVFLVTAVAICIRRSKNKSKPISRRVLDDSQGDR